MTALNGSEAHAEEGLVRKTLEQFERSKVLEIYFARLDGRTPVDIPPELKSLYETDLSLIKIFLSGRRPQLLPH